MVEGNEAVGAEEGDNGLGNVVGEDKTEDTTKSLSIWPRHSLIALGSRSI